MAQRSFDDGFWGSPDFEDVEKDAKYLFIYLWTNKHCNPAALYEITPKTICFETGLSRDDLPRLFQILERKVKWLPDENIVWVRNFVKRQTKSPLFLKAVSKCLIPFNNNGLIKEFLDYNTSLGISIPYQYPINTLSIHTLSDTDTDINNKGGSRGEKKSKYGHMVKSE